VGASGRRFLRAHPELAAAVKKTIERRRNPAFVRSFDDFYALCRQAIACWCSISFYAVLHHPEYRERYAANLRRELPRIPFVSAVLSNNCHSEPASAGEESDPSAGKKQIPRFARNDKGGVMIGMTKGWVVIGMTKGWVMIGMTKGWVIGVLGGAAAVVAEELPGFFVGEVAAFGAGGEDVN
jgi:Type ISP C-terminal specificity domain